MPALPKIVDLDSDGVNAWNLLLAAEDAALKKGTSPSPANYLDEVTGVRVLGFFLLDFYTHSDVQRIGLIPYKRIICEIISCFAVSVTDDSDHDEAKFKAVFDLGLSYQSHLLRICEKLTLVFKFCMLHSH